MICRHSEQPLEFMQWLWIFTKREYKKFPICIGYFYPYIGVENKLLSVVEMANETATQINEIEILLENEITILIKITSLPKCRQCEYYYFF